MGRNLMRDNRGGDGDDLIGIDGPDEGFGVVVDRQGRPWEVAGDRPAIGARRAWAAFWSAWRRSPMALGQEADVA